MKKINTLGLVFISILVSAVATAQTLEMANSETNSKNTACTSCAIVVPENAADNSTTTFSEIQLNVATPTGFTEQTVIFPTGACAGDTAYLYFQNPNNLNDGIFTGVTFTSFNGTTSNNENQVVSPGLTISNGTTTLFKFVPQFIYDRVSIRLTQGVNTLTRLRIYYAQKLTNRPTFTGDFIICRGDSTDITTSTPGKPLAMHAWYDQATGGNQIFNGATYRAKPTVTTTYYIERCNPNNFLRTPVTVTVVQPPVAASTPARVQVCHNTAVTLSATTTTPGCTFNWYDAPSKGTLLKASSSTYNTPKLTQTDTFYIESITVIDGCISTTRTMTIVDVSPQMPLPIAGNDTVCTNNTATLTATFPADAAFAWYSDSTGGNLLSSSATYNPTFSNAGKYDFWLSSNLNNDNPDCGASFPRKKVSVLVKPRPTDPTVSGDNAVCNGSVATINATTPTPGATLHWYKDLTGGTEIFTGNNYTTQSVLADSVYYIEADLNGCTSVNRTKFTVRAKLIPVPPTLTGTTTICKNTNTQLTASSTTSNASFIWKDMGGNIVANTAVYNTPNLPNNTTYLVFSTLEGCISDTTEVTVTTGDKIQPPTIRCGNSTINTIVFEWDPIPNANGYKVSINGSAFVTTNGTTSHTISGVNFGETRSIRVLTVGTPPCQDSDPSASFTCAAVSCIATTFTSKADFEICSGSDAVFTINNINSNNFSVKWNGGTATKFDTVFTLAGVTTNQTVSVEVIDSNQVGCPTTTKQIKVKVNPNPVAQFTSNKTITNSDDPVILFLDGTSGSTQYAWDFGDTGTSIEKNPIHAYPTDGQYTVTLIVGNQFNCFDTLTKQDYISIRNLPFIIIPNAFSPNGDGQNDVFVPKTRRISTYEMKVFNEWGQQLFATNDLTTGWDGQFDGVKQQVGVYFYVVKATDETNKDYFEKGVINLIR